MAADETIKINLQVEGNAEESIGKTADSVKSLKQQFREANAELQKLSDTPGIDPEKIRAQARVVGQLKDALGDANDMARSFSGNNFENMSSSLGGVKDALLNLDFSKANDMAKNFAASAKGITFGGAVSSLKDLGSTFMTLGKSLLTNPLFLIGAAIALLVVAIVKVLDKLGVLKKITELVGKYFDFLFSIIESVVTAITDFIGVTSEAERQTVRSYERMAAAAEENAIRTKNANEEIIQSIDTKIKIAELEGKSTEGLERQKLQRIRETAKAEYDRAQTAYESALRKGDLDKKEIADLKEKARTARLSLKQSRDDITIFEKETLKQKEDANKKKQDEDDRAAKTAAEKADAAREESLAKQKQYENQRISTTRQIEDLRSSLTKAGYEKEISDNNLKYDRLIEDTKRNEALLQTEKDQLISLYNRLRKSESDRIYAEEDKREADRRKAIKDGGDKAMADAIAAEDKAWNEEKARGDLKVKYTADAREKEILERQNANQQELVDLQKSLDSGLITRQQYDEYTRQAELQKNKDIDAINEEYAQKEKDRRRSIADAALNVTGDSLNAIANLASAFAGKSEKAQEKAFKLQKGVQIAQATMDTYKSAVSAYQSVVGVPVVGPALAVVAAAAAVAAGIANIKKIQSTKFKGSETPSNETPPTPNLNVGGVGGGAAPTPPSLNITGGAMSGSVGGNLQLFGERQTPIKAIVVESEITGTQNKLQNYQQMAEFG